MILDTGQTVGPYRILGLLGRGGMGRVFRVEHTITRRVEAMKILGPQPDDAEAARFEREIQLQAHLHHPNIAAVHTAFRIGGELFLVMELVEGQSLDRMIEQGKIPLLKALDYSCQALSALAYAHSKGVVHRDIAPGNLIVTAEGRVKLTDFGLARSRTDARKSLSGAPAGSPAYMSPEQVHGSAEIDARSDLYSLGTVLYELATGVKPVSGDSPFELMRAQVECEPKPPRAIDPGLPELLDGILAQALKKNPEERFRSANDFRSALMRLRNAVVSGGGRAGVAIRLIPRFALPRFALPSLRLGPRGWRIALASAAIVAAAGYGSWNEWQKKPAAPIPVAETIVQTVPKGNEGPALVVPEAPAIEPISPAVPSAPPQPAVRVRAVSPAARSRQTRPKTVPLQRTTATQPGATPPPPAAESARTQLAPLDTGPVVSRPASAAARPPYPAQSDSPDPDAENTPLAPAAPEVKPRRNLLRRAVEKLFRSRHRTNPDQAPTEDSPASNQPE